MASLSEELARRHRNFFLRQAYVFFSDGKAFGNEQEGFVRLNFGCPRARLQEALEHIERAVHSLPPS